MPLRRICKSKPDMPTDTYTRAHLRPAIRIVAIVGVLASLALGCGDDEGAGANTRSAPATTEEVTKAAYIEKGDAACIRHNRKIQQDIEAYVKLVGDISQPKIATQIVNRVLVPRMGHEIRTVRAFVLPPANVDGALRVLTAMQEVVDRAVQDPVAFVKSGQPFAKPEFLGVEFGFDICGGLLVDRASAR